MYSKLKFINITFEEMCFCNVEIWILFCMTQRQLPLQEPEKFGMFKIVSRKVFENELQRSVLAVYAKCMYKSYNHFHNTFDVVPNFPFNLK